METSHIRPLQIVLAGSSGMPGQQILEGLQALALSTAAYGKGQTQITILTRHNKSIDSVTNEKDSTIQTQQVDYENLPQLVSALTYIRPDVVISALKAEPAPLLDDILLTAVIQSHQISAATARTSDQVDRPLFISGYTLDFMHPSATALATDIFLGPKIRFAERLAAEAHAGRIRCTTLITAGFIDYILAKGYASIDIKARKTTLFNGGQALVTGCTTRFVGAMVAEIIRAIFLNGDGTEGVGQYINKRVQIAEVIYSGQLLLKEVYDASAEGGEFGIVYTTTDEQLEKGKEFLKKEDAFSAVPHLYNFLVWSGCGATYFEEGLRIAPSVQRSSLRDIVRTVVAEVLQ